MMQGLPMDDMTVLRMLDAFDRQGKSAREIAAAVGRTRNSVLGTLKRVRDDLAASEAAPFAPGTGPAVRVGNRDGDMPARWWAAPRGPARCAG